MRSVNTVCAVSIALVSAYAVPAMSDDVGKAEYMDSCAACHGVDAKGNGPVANLMTVVVPPLTGLAAANGGVFPMDDVIAYIDGRKDVRAHGSGMPVWGSVYRDPVAGMVKGQSPDFIARGRILSLAYYLESIQE